MYSSHVTNIAPPPPAALAITRAALDAFVVNNRSNVYVLQDVMEDGEEAIFYLRVDESLCQVSSTLHSAEEEFEERSETRAHGESICNTVHMLD